MSRKIFFVFLLLPFISCTNMGGKTDEERQTEHGKEKFLDAYETISEYQLSWAKAQLNLTYWVADEKISAEKTELKEFLNAGPATL